MRNPSPKFIDVIIDANGDLTIWGFFLFLFVTGLLVLALFAISNYFTKRSEKRKEEMRNILISLDAKDITTPKIGYLSAKMKN